MVDYITDYLENIRNRKVFPPVTPGKYLIVVSFTIVTFIIAKTVARGKGLIFYGKWRLTAFPGQIPLSPAKCGHFMYILIHK